MSKSDRLFTFLKNDGFPFLAKKIERNIPCACGSGKKAKKCCGVKTEYFSTKPETAPPNEYVPVRNLDDLETLTTSPTPEPLPLALVKEPQELSRKKFLLNVLKEFGEVSIAQLREQLDPVNYNNNHSYLSVMLSQLVKSGNVERTGRGVYKFVTY